MFFETVKISDSKISRGVHAKAFFDSAGMGESKSTDIAWICNLQAANRLLQSRLAKFASDLKSVILWEHSFSKWAS